MEKVILFIIHWSIFQLIAIIILLLIYIFTKKVIDIKLKYHYRRIKKISKILQEIVHGRSTLNTTTIQFFKDSIIEFLKVFERANKKYRQNPQWDTLKSSISDLVLRPQAKLLAYSINLYKRYLATQCYILGKNIVDEKVLSHLVDDDAFLISLNAALFIFENPTEHLINKVIDNLSKVKGLKQSVFANVLANQLLKNVHFITEIIIKRLGTDKNIHTRIFCYQLLIFLKSKQKIDFLVNQDLASTNNELKVLALEYLVQIDSVAGKSILLKYLGDPNIELRATAVKLLGTMEDQALLHYLEPMLCDQAWLVRMYAADALMRLGQKGIAALKNQSPEKDKFAFETAQAFLKIHSDDHERG